MHQTSRRASCFSIESWFGTGAVGDGPHVMSREQRSTLDKNVAPNWKPVASLERRKPADGVV